MTLSDFSASADLARKLTPTPDLEFSKIIDRLVDYSDFSASADLARRLTPTSDLEEAKLRQAATREARHILSLDSEVSFQMAQDIRPPGGAGPA